MLAWRNAMESNAVPDAASLYAPAVRINGEGGLATPSRMHDYWRDRHAIPGWSFRREHGDEPEVTWEAPLATAQERRACGDGAVARAVLRMVQLHPQRSSTTSRAVPCETLRGRYRLRLRETPAGWRICDETFLLVDFCASCPAARACRR
ncbi:MAG: hypothetical protein R3A48_19270 [Polyangiales bacterium]